MIEILIMFGLFLWGVLLGLILHKTFSETTLDMPHKRAEKEKLQKEFNELSKGFDD